jgi:arylsulfatase A-like enzyme
VRDSPNLILVILDCVRAKSLRPCGPGPYAETPNLNSLARRGVSFDRAVAPANWTVPSHWSILTGEYPALHGRRLARREAGPVRTLATTLAEIGYETAMFSEQDFLLAGLGLEQGYQRKVRLGPGPPKIFDQDSHLHSYLPGADLLYSEFGLRLLGALPPLIVPVNMTSYRAGLKYKREVCSDSELEGFRNWLVHRKRDRPFHVLINLVDAHEPYEPTPRERRLAFMTRWYSRTHQFFQLLVPELQRRTSWEVVEDEYHQAISFADKKLGHIVEALEDTGELASSWIFVTSDHGQSMGEAGNIFHGNGVADSITRVPLVIAPPEHLPVPTGSDEWTSLTEIPRWFEKLARGRSIYDGNAVIELSRGQIPLPSGVAYCEGSPPSDNSTRTAGRRPHERWNHRLLAAYRRQDKWVLDQDSGEILHWKLRGMAHDSDPEEILRGRDEITVRQEIFAPYLSLEAARPQGASSDILSAGTVAHRLSTWGYDG